MEESFGRIGYLVWWENGTDNIIMYKSSDVSICFLILSIRFSKDDLVLCTAKFKDKVVKQSDSQPHLTNEFSVQTICLVF